MRIIKKRKEKGNIIDMCSSLFILLFVFMLLLAYLSYSKAINKKMAIDLVAKNTLYQMEETGSWTQSIENNFLSELENNGIDDIKIEKNESTGVNSAKAGYGEEVDLKVVISFKNPARQFKFMNTVTSERIEYEIARSTTAKW